MKILLIRPKPHSSTIGLQHVMICEPLELEYLSAYVSQDGHEVEIIDMIIEKKPISYFVKKHKPQVIGITGYIAHVNVIKQYAREIKATDAICRVVVGGVHAEVVPEDFLDEGIDYIVTGNGLKTFRQLLLALKNQEDPFCIEGIWTEAQPRCLKERVFDYPPPDRSKVAKYRDSYYYMFHNPCALIKTSFGCPYQCSFCFCRQITDGQYFTRSILDIIEELKTIPEREIYIVDDDFLVDRDRILEFCRELQNHQIDKRFLIYARADFIAANEAVIKEFSSCGLRAVIVGLESCREDELLKYNKKSSVDINEEAITILNQYSVECYGTLILGVDWDGEDFKKLYRWIKQLKLMFINLQPFTPMPGTPLYREYQEQLIIPRKEAEKWDLAHLVIQPSKISLSEYYWNIVKLYYKVTMSPSNMIKSIVKYGLMENIKLSMGASMVTLQYLKKIISYWR